MTSYTFKLIYTHTFLNAGISQTDVFSSCLALLVFLFYFSSALSKKKNYSHELACIHNFKIIYFIRLYPIWSACEHRICWTPSWKAAPCTLSSSIRCAIHKYHTHVLKLHMGQRRKDKQKKTYKITKIYLIWTLNHFATFIVDVCSVCWCCRVAFLIFMIFSISFHAIP